RAEHQRCSGHQPVADPVERAVLPLLLRRCEAVERHARSIVSVPPPRIPRAAMDGLQCRTVSPTHFFTILNAVSIHSALRAFFRYRMNHRKVTIAFIAHRRRRSPVAERSFLHSGDISTVSGSTPPPQWPCIHSERRDASST